MKRSDTPKDGDFAAYLARKTPTAPMHDETDVAAADASTSPSASSDSAPLANPQTIADILVEGQEPTDEFLEAWNALADAEPLSDEELARQALEHPGADGDSGTAE